MKAPVSELFFNEKETPAKMLSWKFCEISQTPVDQTSINLQLFWKKDSAVGVSYEFCEMSRTAIL